MGVVAVKSNAITYMDGTSQILARNKLQGGRVKEAVATVELANGDSIASIYRLVRVHSSWRVSQLILMCDAITSAAADFGLYDTAANGAAVVDVDFFASAQSIATLLLGSDVTHEAGGTGNQHGEIANVEKTLWEVLGLTADPNKFYDIAATLTAAATAAGTLSVKLRYLDGN